MEESGCGSDATGHCCSTSDVEQEQPEPGPSIQNELNRLGGTAEIGGNIVANAGGSGMKWNFSGQRLKPLFVQNVEKILIDRNFSADVIDWIKSNITQWNSLACLNNCEDLTPRQVRAISECLKSEFERFVAEKQKVLEVVKSLVGSSKDSFEEVVTDTCDAIISGTLLEFLTSCALLTRDEKRQAYFKFIAPDSETFDKLFHQDEESMEVEYAVCIQPVLMNSRKEQLQLKVCGILRKLDLDEVVEKWILDHICSWSSLESMKECEDLSPRKIREISELLRDSFLEYQEEKLQVEQFTVSIVGDRATEDVIDAVVDAALDDKLLELLQRSGQLRVEQKRKLFLGLADKQGVDVNAVLPRERPAFEAVLVREFETALKEAREKHRLPEEAVCWIQNNWESFDAIEDVSKCEDLTKKQCRLLTADLTEAFVKHKNYEAAKEKVGRCCNSTLYSEVQETFQEDLVVSICEDRVVDFLANSKLNSDQRRKLCGNLGLTDYGNSLSVETSNLDRKFLEKIEEVCDSCKLKPAARNWILDHWKNWMTLDDLSKCEHITPRQRKQLLEELEKDFQSYCSMKEVASCDDSGISKLAALLNYAKEAAVCSEALQFLESNFGKFNTVEDLLDACEDITQTEKRAILHQFEDQTNSQSYSVEDPGFSDSAPWSMKTKESSQMSRAPAQHSKEASPDGKETVDSQVSSRHQETSVAEIQKPNGNESEIQNVEDLLDRMGASNEAKRWLDERLLHMKSVHEVLACDHFNESQLKSLWSFLGHERFLPGEGNGDYQLLQLVSCDSVTQDGTLVEKFSISTESIEQVCNFNGSRKLYFQHPSGQVIMFDELNKLKMRMFGVLGRLKDVFEFLARVLNFNPADLESFCEDVKKQGTGLYFMCPKNFLGSEVNACCFIFFHSTKDEDFNKVHAKSRAIHFLRYLTQLAPKSVALINSEDLPSLTAEKPNKAKKTRRQKYTIQKHETQQESCSAVPIGRLSAFDRLNRPKCLFSNLEGMVAVESETSPRKVLNKVEKSTSTAQQFISTLYEKLKIEERADICFSFQNEFVKEVDPESFKQIQLEEEQVERDMRNCDYEADLQINLTFSLLCRLMEKLCPRELRLLRLCSDKLEGNPITEMLAKRTKFECFDKQKYTFDSCSTHSSYPVPSSCVFSFLPKSQFMNNVVAQIEKCKLLQTFFLRAFIREEKENKKESDAEDDELKSLSFEKLIEKAKKKKLKKFHSAAGWFGATYNMEKFLDILVSEAEQLNFDQKIVEALENEMVSFMHFIDNITQTISRSGRFCAYVQKKLDEKVKESKANLRNRVINETFWSIINQRDKYMVEERAGTLKKVEETKNASDRRYQIHFVVSKVEEEKKCLALYKLLTDRDLAQKLNDPSQSFNPAQLKCSAQLGQKLSFAKSDQLLYIYCVQKDIFMMVINQADGMSRIRVVNTTKNSDYCDQKFGKPIAACDYDNKSRVLCLQRKTDIEAPELNFFKFSEDFKTAQNHKTLNQLKQLLGVEILVDFALQYQSNFVWCLEGRRLLKIDIKSGALSSSVKLADVTSNKYCSMRMLPNGSCLLLYSEEGFILRVMCETLHVLEELRISDSNLANEGFFTIAGRIVGIDYSKNLSEILVTGASHELKMSRTDAAGYGTVMNSDDQKNVFNWLYYFYWIFTKFPCSDILAHDQEDIELSFYVADSFSLPTEALRDCLENCVSSVYEALKKTQKPLDRLKIGSIISVVANPFQALVQFNALPKMVRMGDFMRRLISFVPIQIARCQSNEFYCLDNGVPLSTGEVQDAFELQEKISLGLFETIFNEWKGPVKVISSMGKQSTGKSFTLNHLTGSSFNIAGTRCTDGCWMTVKSHEDCLYVILDFEGLGSFERTDQDDMLLSLFNSALSNMTIFKTEYRIDRDTEQMFQKFNLASDQLKGTKKVFQGTFNIVIKDVAAHDLDDIHHEFGEKVGAMISKSKENNFISKLYQGGFEIFPFPAFESSDYYMEMEQLASNMQREIQPVFDSGSQFMQTMKIMLAKLAICDFTPLSRQQIDSRVRKLRDMLPTALEFGQEEPWPVKQEFSLRDLEDVSNQVPSETKVSLGEDPSLNEVVLDDTKFRFSEDSSIIDVIGLFSGLFPQNADNFLHWRSALERFIRCSLNHRFERVATWLQINTQKWRDENNPEFDDAILSLMDSFENQKNNLEHSYKLCDDKCEKCYLKCTQKQGHIANHRCNTNHRCPGFCQYCEEQNDCKLNFGHDDKHICSTVSHVCGEACSFKEANGCENECRKVTGHEDEHACSLSKHVCQETCSLEGCRGRCQLDCEILHSVHKCAKDQCSSECGVKNCHNQCAARNHFHSSALSDKFMEEQGVPYEAPFVLEDGETRFDCADHFCGKDHGCGEVCESSTDGYCHVYVEKEREGLTFEGERDKFTYSLKFVQRGESKNCVRRLKPFQRSHEGSHSCSSDPDKVHFCKQKCPTCENICDKATGHGNSGDLLHHTNHGNMRFCYFVSNKEDIEVGQHKYKVGEEAVAELCHIFCSTLGRGHVHVVPCDSDDPKNCVYSAAADLRRHETCSYLPDKEVPKDEVQHSKYWESINFVDPCQPSDIESFANCPFFCSAAEHEKEDDKSYCELALWHGPATSISEAGLSSGTLTKDGHVFPCVHESSKYHFILALDDSGSMTKQPWNDLVIAANAFVANRQLQSTSDYLSVMMYSDSVLITAEYINIGSFNASTMLKYRSGGTKFSIALSTVDEIIGRHLSKDVQPCLLFMSDGHSYDGEVQMQALVDKYRTDYKLAVYTLGFGSANFAKLRELARIGKGQYVEAVNGIDLKNAFMEIAAKYPPNIGVSSAL